MKRSVKKATRIVVALLLVAVMLCAGGVSTFATTVTDAVERTGISFEVETTNGLTHPTGYYYSPKQLEQIPVTFEAWVYIPSAQYSGKNAVISNYLEISGDEFFDFCIHPNGIPCLYIGRGLGESYATFEFSDAQVPADAWTHVSVVYGTGSEGKQAFCYINGELKHQSAASNYVSMNERVLENPVCLGGDLRSFNQQWFKGQLGEVRVYADVRSQAEIAADMTTAADRNDQDLIMYYELSADLSGKDVEDKGPNGYDMLYGEMWLTEQEMEQIRATDSNEYAYSIAVLPDPQFSTQYYPNSLKATFDYLLDNAEAKNIQYVLSVGDMTNGNTEAQWENIKAQTERLNGKLPYTAIRGNHDVYYNGSAELFDQYYADPSGYYYQHVQQNGGFYDTSSVKNTYLLFEVGNVKYLLLNLDFGADDNVLAWADGILSVFSDRRVIAITHAYMDADGTTLDDYDSGSPSTNANKGDLGWNSGEDMWNELFKKHANVQMVICGHIQQDDIIMRTRKGDAGNTVYQLLIDTQTSDERIKGGGFVAMLYFTEDGNNVRVECYSTVQEKYFRSVSNTISFAMESESPSTPPSPNDGDKASLTYGNETTFYASLQEAITAANAGNGGTITLLADADYGTVTTGVTFNKHITIDGQGQYKITATVGKEFLQPNAGVTLRLKDLDLIVTSTTAKKYYSAVYVNASDARVIIEGCTIQSTNDNAIKAASAATNSSIQISGSTVIGNYLGIYMTNSPCDLVISNSTIIDKLSAIYIGSQDNTPDITITNSTLMAGGYNGSTKYGVLTAKKGYANITLGAGTVIGGTAIDSTLVQSYGITTDDYTGAPYGVWFYSGCTPALTLTGDVTLSGEEADLYLQVGTVDFVDYTGAQIIRLSGTTYYFYDELADALADAADGDTIKLCCNLTLDTAVTISRSVTIDGQGKYYIQSSADTAFNVNGAITVTFSHVSLTADNVAFTYDGNADINTSVILNTVALFAGTETVGMNEGDTFTNDSKTVAKLSNATSTIGYLSLQAAIDAANAGNGGTITLLDDVDLGSVTSVLTFKKNITIDGQGQYKITAKVEKEFLQPAAGVTLRLKDLDLIVTSTTANKYYSAVYVNASDARVIIEGCTVQSTNDTAIKATSAATNSSIQISGSTVIGNYLGIYMTNSPCDLVISNSTIIDKLSAIYASGDGSPVITITNSVLTSGGSTKYAVLDIKTSATVTLGTGTVIDSTGTDIRFGTFFADHGLAAADYTGALYGVRLTNASAKLTLSGNVTINDDLYLDKGNGTVIFGTADAPFTGIQIIRLSGTTYYFYDTVDAAFTAKQDGDSIFSYAASSVQNKGYVTQTATDASSNTYYTVVGLDTSLIDNAISNANSKKDGIAQAEKPCEAGVGNKYVSAAQMQTLNQAIAAAEAKKASATTGGAVIEAVQALNDALASFETAILTGVAHKDDDRNHACDECGIEMNMNLHTDSDTDDDHVCDYGCGERLNDCTPNEDDGDCTTAITCSVCGEVTTAAKAAHTPAEDDGDCTTAITCTECGTVTTAAKAAHTPAEDDGDCTTAITCTECGTVTTAAKAAHTGGSATCTAKATCSVCGKTYGELAQHIYDGDTDATCNVCGAERTVENGANGNENNTSSNENTANGSENNAQNGNTEAPAKKGLSGGAIAGIVIGAVAVLGGGVALLWFAIKKKRL